MPSSNEPFCKPYKLRDDSWGVRVSPVPEVGDVLTCIANNGKSWPTQIDSIERVFEQDDTAICRTCAPPKNAVPKEQMSLLPSERANAIADRFDAKPVIRDIDPDDNWYGDTDELPF